MKLSKLQITNYKCVRDSEPFEVDERVTCLVGKNQAGKSAILEALEKLKPVEPSDAEFRDVDHYPRQFLIDYQERCQQEGSRPANVVSSTWTLEPQDLEETEKVIGPAARSTKHVVIRRGYGNRTSWDLGIDDKINARVVRHYLDKHHLTQEEREPLAGAENLAELKTKVAEIAEPERRQKELAEDLEAFGDHTIGHALIEALSPRLPTLVYFPEYWRLRGQVSVNQLKQRSARNALSRDDQMVLALLSMVNRSLADLEKIDQHEQLIASLEAVGNRLTQVIFKYWKQNRDLRVQFRFEQGMPGDDPPFNEGWILRTRIENPRHGVTTSFDQQSSGFKWFFSFLVWFSQVRRNFGDNLVLLLDEPGLGLHAKAQDDLLRYIESELALNYQLIYTTHSPFMIDHARLLRARTVEDVFIRHDPKDPDSEDKDLGTKVRGDVLSTDRDTLFPLQGALGYSITQTLFVGEHTLLVEGPSEILYVEWFKQRLARLGRTPLDPRWVVCPCGGVGNVPAFISLFYGQKLHIAVLTDLAPGEKRKVRDLRESRLLKDGHVLTADMYAGQPEADVEDLLGRPLYTELVAKTYALANSQRLPPERPSGSSIRVVKEVEGHFRTLPPEVAEFGHYAPAEYLMKQGPEVELPGLTDALDRFEAIFRDLNAMLS